MNTSWQDRLGLPFRTAETWAAIITGIGLGILMARSIPDQRADLLPWACIVAGLFWANSRQRLVQKSN